jgi:hypothetical protein
MKLKAGALLYVLIISIIAILFCGIFIIAMYQGGRIIDDKAIMSSLESEVNSAIVYTIANTTDSTAKNAELDLFEDTPYKASVSFSNWGLYWILTAQASQNELQVRKMILLGVTSPDIFTTALYVPNNTQYISASGKTVIKGNCYLPKNGIRPEYSGNESFVGDSLPYGKVLKSEQQLPELAMQRIETLYSSTLADSSIRGNLDDLQSSSPITNSFARTTTIYYSKQKILLTCRLLSGNIIVKSDSMIEISSNCKLKNVILIAPYVTIDKDVNGNFQAFARKNIIVDENVKLFFPSSLVLLEKENAGNNFTNIIQIKEHAIVCGTILFLAKKQYNNFSRIIIDKDATVYGTVYSNNRTELKGSVFGSVYTESFFLQTPSSIFENLLQSATIDVRKLPKEFSNGCFFRKGGRFKEIGVIR